MNWQVADFNPALSGPQFQWLNERLTLHGFPVTRYTLTLRDRVMAFQKSLGFTGSGADGYIGPKTLAALQLPPKDLQRISRRDWKLTLPDATEIQPPEFELFERKPWFWETESGEQVFRAPTSGGATTSDATKYLRSETRQMKGLAKAAWDPRVDPHNFRGSMCFTALPHVKEHAVGFQIHDGKDDVLQGRLEGRKLFLGSPHVSEKIVLTDNYQLGTWFDFEIRPTKSGIIVFYNGDQLMLANVVGSGWYYKYGCYIQAYAGQKFNNQIVPKDSWAEVRYRAAEVRAA